MQHTHLFLRPSAGHSACLSCLLGAYWCTRNYLCSAVAVLECLVADHDSFFFCRMATEANPEIRFMNVIGWYLSTLNSESSVFKRKPWVCCIASIRAFQLYRELLFPRIPLLAKCLLAQLRSPSRGLSSLLQSKYHITRRFPRLLSHARISKCFTAKSLLCDRRSVAPLSYVLQDGRITDAILHHRDAVLTASGNMKVLFQETEVYECLQGLPCLMVHGSALSEPYGRSFFFFFFFSFCAEEAEAQTPFSLQGLLL